MSDATAAGLTEAERVEVAKAIHDEPGEPCQCAPVYATVERILADRLAAVQAERVDRWIIRIAEEVDRAVAAEAERDAARAEVEALRERVEALVDESLSRPQPGYISALALRAAMDADR